MLTEKVMEIFRVRLQVYVGNSVSELDADASCPDWRAFSQLGAPLIFYLVNDGAEA